MHFKSNLRTVKNVDIAQLVIDVPDYPKPGILFKDITPILSSPTAFRFCVNEMFTLFQSIKHDISAIVGIEARGFIFGAAMALEEHLPFILIRKPGKLPRPSYSVNYDLEYGTDSLHVHKDAVIPGGRYLIVDDVLATGGTAIATAQLLTENGGTVVGFSSVMEISQLDGRQKINRFFPSVKISTVMST